MNFSKIIYPKCPHCKVEINDLDEIPLGIVGKKYGKEKACPCCKKEFGLIVKLELICEAEK